MFSHIAGITEELIAEESGRIKLIESEGWKERWDKLVGEAVLGDETKSLARWIIWEIGQNKGVRPASINDLYMARGRGETTADWSVPAFNMRGMAYDFAKAIFAKATEHNVGALIIEIARSEMGYCDRSPGECAAIAIAAAVRGKWSGPLFLQGDHFQAKEVAPGVPKDGEMETIRKIIRDAIKAGFYNIDIDMSTLVDYGKPTEAEQQKVNIDTSLELTKLIREIEPEGITVSVGGEIGHIGGKNSTVAELRAYLKGYSELLPEGMVGMSKISPQTGTSHGGVVMPDGTLADVDVDFGVLAEISKVCREEYQMGGAVQHGASTLPDEFFSQFVTSEAAEVHLATGFQNIEIDHEAFPKELRDKMYKWLDENMQDERKEGQTDEQFHYKTRKKAFGPFKSGYWGIPEEQKAKIQESLLARVDFMYQQLRVINSKELVNKHVKAPEIRKNVEDFGEGEKIADVKGLSD